jgi:hypothetical protein
MAQGLATTACHSSDWGMKIQLLNYKIYKVREYKHVGL